MSTVRFSPGQRLAAPKVDAGKIAVKECLPAPRPIPRTKMQIILPAVIGVAFVGMIVLIISQPGLRSGPMGFFSFFFPFMMLASFGGMFMMGRHGGSDKTLTPAQMEVARRDYLMELDDIRDVVHADAARQFGQFAWFHPEPGLLRGLVGSARMWERVPGQPHFAWVRIGVGKTDLTKKFDTPLLGEAADYEPVTYDALRSFLLEQKLLRGIAKPVSLTANPGLGLVGSEGMGPVYELARAMICQAAVFHSPRDFKIMVVTDDVSRWDWLKWLPHCQHWSLTDSGGPARMLWGSPEEMDAAVGAELHQERKGFGEKSGSAFPHWLVINDQSLVSTEWQTLTRKGGVAGVTFVRLAAELGSGVGFENGTTLFVTASMVRTQTGPLAVPDQLDEVSARAIARRVARFHPDSQDAVGLIDRPRFVDLFDILGLGDAAAIDVDRAWAATRSGPPWEENPWGTDWLRIPIGLDENGGTVAVDFKETHEGGMGHHMVLVGTTGSGKSQFWTTLVLSAALTHSPESLNIAFFDFKGTTTAHSIDALPHVVAAMNNLRNDSLWIERMGDVIYGELERRKRMLDRARVSDAAEYEYRRIHGGEKLEPMPHLLIIVDEFTQMFKQYPPAKEVMDEIGRQGRALGVRLLMGSQRLGHEMATGIMSNIPIRAALRTLDDSDSRAVVGNDEAKYLPMKPAGAGLLRVEGRPRLTRFQTAFVSQNYTPPRHAAAAAVRTQAGYAPPQEFSATGMLSLPELPAAPEVVESTPKVVVGPDGRPLRQAQAAITSLRRHQHGPVHRMWLPPLEPLPIDELVRRLRGRAWDDGYGENRGLRFLVGVEDRPFQHAQRVYALDMSEGNCGVIGQGNAGKTVAITTMITGAALMYTPKRAQFYVIALSGPDINAVARLPHVGSFARESQPERVGRTIAEMRTLIDEREAAFTELGLTIEGLRRRKFDGEPGPVPDDMFGDVFLVIDGWAQFMTSFEPLVDDVMTIMDKGPAHGVHAVVSASGWIAGKLRSGMPQLLTTNVELKLASTDDLTRNKLDVAKTVPFGEREVFRGDEDGDDPDTGARGEEQEAKIVKVRGRGTSMAGYHFQTALPQLRLGGRLVGVGEATAAITEVAGGAGAAAQVRMLPTVVSLQEVQQLWQRRGGGRGGQVPFGISEVGLLPAVADFGASPHLLLAGRRECGLSTALATLARGVMRAYTPEHAQIYVVDPHNGLLQVVPEGAHLGAYAYREGQIRDMAVEVAALLESRLPTEEATQADLAAGVQRWSGPEVFVFVDREETIQSWDRGGWQEGTGYPLEPLVGFLDRGREVGLHLVVSRRLAQWGRAALSPLVGRLLQAKVAGVVMDGDRGEGAIIADTKAVKFPPGRGIYVTDKLVAPVQIATSTGEC
jgi:S-DNA-T family DNA segregation ATPase FtsK/SpoIIIE